MRQFFRGNILGKSKENNRPQCGIVRPHRPAEKKEEDVLMSVSGWEEFYDERYQRPYYYHTVDKKSQWVKPEGEHFFSQKRIGSDLDVAAIDQARPHAPPPPPPPALSRAAAPRPCVRPLPPKATTLP